MTIEYAVTCRSSGWKYSLNEGVSKVALHCLGRNGSASFSYFSYRSRTAATHGDRSLQLYQEITRMRALCLPVFPIPNQERDATWLQYTSNFLYSLVVVGVAPVPSLGTHKVCLRKTEISHLSDENRIGPTTLLASCNKCPLTQRDRDCGFFYLGQEYLAHSLRGFYCVELLDETWP